MMMKLSLLRTIKHTPCNHIINRSIHHFHHHSYDFNRLVDHYTPCDHHYYRFNYQKCRNICELRHYFSSIPNTSSSSSSSNSLSSSSSSIESSSSVSSSSILSNYARLCAEGEYQHDDAQYKLVKLLAKIERNVIEYQQQRQSSPSMPSIPSLDDSKITTNSYNNGNDNDDGVDMNARPRLPRGLYLYGNVGTGKTFLMDFFYQHCHPSIPKRRVHFHKFMLKIHKLIRNEKQKALLRMEEEHDDVTNNSHEETSQQRQKNQRYHLQRLKQRQQSHLSERDAIVNVAKHIAKDVTLLCFDEFQVLDVCDALILVKLFHELWSHGIVLIATSNRPPQDLYKDGLNRHYFLPFIDSLMRNCLVKEINSMVDYRLLSYQKRRILGYAFPVTELNLRWLVKEFEDMSALYNNHSIASTRQTISSVPGSSNITSPISMHLADIAHICSVPVMMGRSVDCWVCSHSSRVCFVDFSYLCDSDRGASDYQALCRQFICVFVYGIPTLSKLHHNIARRFILLVDEIYDSGVLMRWVAAAPPLELFTDARKASDSGESSDESEIDAVDDSEMGNKINAVDTLLESPLQRGYDNRMFPVKVKIGEVNSKLNASPLPIPVKEESLNVMQGELASIVELKFAFQRTSSRLCAMASDEYFETWKEMNKQYLVASTHAAGSRT